MSYAVKEIYYTLQGEGAQSGRPAVFCRFSGCNLWNGREEDRAGAICTFCDTNFVGVDGPGGGRFETAEQLTEAITRAWPRCEAPSATSGPTTRFVVCTGGEPLLQLDSALVDALHAAGFEIAVETNGTRLPPPDLDWICVSPKGGAPLAIAGGDELKLVYPQPDAQPSAFEHLAFRHFFLSPMDGPRLSENTQAAIHYCLGHPRWKLSIQAHKLIGMP